jgi:hypothetical protein
LLVYGIAAIAIGAVLAWLSISLARGSTSARWTVGLLTFVLLWHGVVIVFGWYDVSPWEGVTSIAVAAAALYLLFGAPRSREYYARAATEPSDRLTHDLAVLPVIEPVRSSVSVDRRSKSSLQNEFAESAMADEAAAEGKHGFVHIRAPFVAHEQPFELVQVREGAFDDPAQDAEPGAVPALAAGDHGCDTERAYEPAMLVVVVAAVTDDLVGTAAWPADEPCHGRHALEQRDQLGDVVAVAAAERVGERDPGRVDEQVVLGSGSASVDRARARFGAPFFACTWLESTMARDHSISPAARRRASSSACSFSQTPACCHSSSRRQHV